jgi:NTE family protein
MTGQAVGLVLGGGGARGFAHLGVIKALRGAGIPIDLIGGTSMGAVVGSGVALEWDDKLIYDIMRKAFVTSNPVNDYTVPVVALIRGRKVSQRLRQIFGDLAIEDLWRPFFAVACNLTKGATEVQRTGPLWRALRATVALPGVMPPVVVNREILVDGGVINNLPVDVMSNLGRGPVIGVDVAKDPALTCDDENLEDLSLWQMLRRGERNRPGILSVLMRSGTVSSAAQSQLGRSRANLYLAPELEDIDMLDWQAMDTVIERGYRCTIAELDRRQGKLF